MINDIWLEWWHEGQWHEIGWRADTSDSRRDLQAHGAALAESRPGHYRLVTQSHLADAPPIVIHSYPVRVA